METPYVDCSPADEHEGEAREGGADDDEDGAFGHGGGWEEGVLGYVLWDDDLVGGDVGGVLGEGGKTGVEGG